eukprot:scaffold1147_cov68-Phaeocystis_antarctica.AAC.2
MAAASVSWCCSSRPRASEARSRATPGSSTRALVRVGVRVGVGVGLGLKLEGWDKKVKVRVRVRRLGFGQQHAPWCSSPRGWRAPPRPAPPRSAAP